MVIQDFDTGKTAFGVQANQHADRFAGKALKAAVIYGFVGIAEQFLELIHRIHREIRQLVFNDGCRRKQLLDQRPLAV